MSKTKSSDITKKDSKTITVVETITEVVSRDRTISDLRGNKKTLLQAKIQTLTSMAKAQIIVDSLDAQMADIDAHIAEAVSLGVVEDE